MALSASGWEINDTVAYIWQQLEHKDKMLRATTDATASFKTEPARPYLEHKIVYFSKH